MNKGFEAARGIQRVNRDRKRHAEQTKLRRREIENNPELTPEQKRGQIGRLEEEALAKHHKFNREIVKLQKEGKEWAKRVRADWPVDAAMVTRVRELRREGVAPDTILKHAADLGDAQMVAALRADMLWFKGEDGFADASDTIHACERVLAEIGRGGEADVNFGLVRLEEATETVAAVDLYAGKTVIGHDTPHDTLTMAYATGAGRVDDGD